MQESNDLNDCRVLGGRKTLNTLPSPERKDCGLRSLYPGKIGSGTKVKRISSAEGRLRKLRQQTCPKEMQNEVLQDEGKGHQRENWMFRNEGRTENVNWVNIKDFFSSLKWV